VQDDHEHHLHAATAISKAIEGLSVPRDYSYYINLFILNLTIALLSYRAESCVSFGGVAQ
jgi:hypothetical protein